MVLAAAVRALGADRVVAATAVSPSLPAAERAPAAEFAASLGVRHEQPRTDELSREGYRANAGDRCASASPSWSTCSPRWPPGSASPTSSPGPTPTTRVAGFRPGIRAAAERGAVAPLRDAGLTKDDVRAASRALGAAAGTSRPPPAWPAGSPTASRCRAGPAGPREAAEAAAAAALAAAGLAVRNLRVRDMGDASPGSRSTPPSSTRWATPELLAAVAGFDRVEVDPRGLPVGLDERAAARPGPLPLTRPHDPRRRDAGAEAVVDVDHQRRPARRR